MDKKNWKIRPCLNDTEALLGNSVVGRPKIKCFVQNNHPLVWFSYVKVMLFDWKYNTAKWMSFAITAILQISQVADVIYEYDKVSV